MPNAYKFRIGQRVALISERRTDGVKLVAFQATIKDILPTFKGKGLYILKDLYGNYPYPDPTFLKVEELDIPVEEHELIAPPDRYRFVEPGSRFGRHSIVWNHGNGLWVNYNYEGGTYYTYSWPFAVKIEETGNGNITIST